MLLDNLQELQWHNSQYMKLYTYVTHATMLQLDHCKYYAITLWLLCHYVATIVQLHKQQCVDLTFKTKPLFIEFSKCYLFFNNPNAFSYILYNLERWDKQYGIKNLVVS